MKMRNYIGLIILLIPFFSVGCSGGGGLSISGGSIPGGGTIKGLIVLPNGQPMTNPVITVKSLSTQQALAVSPSYQSSGSFTITGVPTNQNVSVVFSQSTTTLKVSVSKTQFTGSSTADIGTVNSVTTVVTQSLENEVLHSPEHEDDIINQQANHQKTEKEGEDDSENEQEQEINDSIVLDNAVKTLITKTANSELATLVSSNTTLNAQIALIGLNGYIDIVQNGSDDLSSTSFDNLVADQVAGKAYTSDQIVTSLAAAGVTTTISAISTADSLQRTRLTSFVNLGASITPFEALAIAATPVSAGGYGLGPTATTQFVNALP